MTFVSIVTDSGLESSIEATRSDLVAEVKARIVREFPFFRGIMLALTLHGKDLADERPLGSYGLLNINGVRLLVTPIPQQPFAPVDYDRIAKSLIRDGFKADSASIPAANAPEDWPKTWSGGDSYKSFPPVDVNNPFSTVPPSSSRELTFSQRIGTSAPSTRESRTPKLRSLYGSMDGYNERRLQEKDEREELENTFSSARKAYSDAKVDTTSVANGYAGTNDFATGEYPSRRFVNLYTCITRGCRFTVFHKAEGKWTGDAVCTDSNGLALSNGAYVCSSRVDFRAKRACWVEQRLVTSVDGISTKMSFAFYPQADSLLHVDTDDLYLREATVKMKEVNSNVMVLTALCRNGLPVLTETLTYGKDFLTRVRSGQRFSTSGKFLVNYVCVEKKYVDEDSGALEPSRVPI